MNVIQGASLARLGRVIALLILVFHTGCIFPMAQAWCDYVLCPLSMMFTHNSPSGQTTASSESNNSKDISCVDSPTSPMSMLISHVSLDWGPLVHTPAIALIEKRVEFQPLEASLPLPNLTQFSPPPETLLLSSI